MTEDIPRSMKLIMLFIDRVGFPTMAFLLMAYMSFVTLRKVTDALADNTRALSTLGTQFAEHRIEMGRALEDLKRRGQ